MTTKIQDTIEKEITVRASKARVFQAITDPAQIIKWFPDKVEGKLEVGESPIFEFEGYGKAQLYVTAVEPYDYFAYRWVPAHVGYPAPFSNDVLSHANTLVEFRLFDGPNGTTIKLKESGFASLPWDVAEKSHTDNTGGWDEMMSRLDKLFAEI